MKRTNLNIVVTIPLLLLLAGILLPHLLPSSETVGRYLLAYPTNKWLLLAAKSSIGVLVLALPYYIYQKTMAHISPKKQQEILDLIKNNTAAKYDLRIAERDANIETILENCGSRGFTLPQGFVAGDTADLYKKELHAFSEILSSTMSEIVQSDSLRMPSMPLASLAEEMISNKAKEFASLYADFMDHYFRFLENNERTEIKNEYYAEIENEAKLITTRISTAIQIKEKL